jgi:hypothetical protein
VPTQPAQVGRGAVVAQVGAVEGAQGGVHGRGAEGGHGGEGWIDGRAARAVLLGVGRKGLILLC